MIYSLQIHIFRRFWVPSNWLTRIFWFREHGEYLARTLVINLEDT